MSTALRIARGRFGRVALLEMDRPLVVVAEDSYLAEDALDLIAVNYETLAPVVDPEAALADDCEILRPPFTRSGQRGSAGSEPAQIRREDRPASWRAVEVSVPRAGYDWNERTEGSSRRGRASPPAGADRLCLERKSGSAAGRASSDGKGPRA
jgi:hypothetical protein